MAVLYNVGLIEAVFELVSEAEVVALVCLGYAYAMCSGMVHDLEDTGGRGE